MSDVDRTIWGWTIQSTAETNYGIETDLRSKVGAAASKWLCIDESYARRSYVYSTSIWKNYKGVITFNKKLYDMYKDSFKMILLPTVPFMRKYRFDKSEIVPFDQKITGACIVALATSGYSVAIDQKWQCDAAVLKFKVASNLNSPGFVVDCYGGTKYNDSQWKGGTDDKLLTTTKYKFAIAFENTYHELWSWDYLTEKMLDCFACGTIPIYFGCYNVEQKIPNHLFIDYRKFTSDSELRNYLLAFDKHKYEDTINEAYEFYQKYPHYEYDNIFKTVLK